MAGRKESKEDREDREATDAYLGVLGGTVNQAKLEEADQSDSNK